MVKKGKIIFVNGYWMPGIIGKWIIGSAYPGVRYWLNNFENKAEDFFDLAEEPHTHVYLDASSLIGIDKSANGRYTKAFTDYDYKEELISNAGPNSCKAGEMQSNTVKYKNFTALTKAMDPAKHCFYIVTHSEGGAYGAGLAKILINKGWKVKMVIHLSTDEASGIETPEEPLTYQLGLTARKTHSAIGWGDWVTSNFRIRKGVDKWGIAYRKSAGFRVHNYSRYGDIFDCVRDLQTVEISSKVDSKGKSYFEQTPGTVANGTIFTSINSIKLKYKP